MVSKRASQYLQGNLQVYLEYWVGFVYDGILINTSNTGEWYNWPTRCNNNNFIDLWISSTCFGQSFAHLQERKTVVYSSMVYCPNVVVGWRSGVRRHRLCVRCEGCRSSKHVELIQRTIKLLLLHLVGHLYDSPTLMMHGQTQIKNLIN
jgi:hypothetical protein